MARYAIDLHRTGSTTASLGSVTADATRPRRFKHYDLLVGSEASPADNPFLWSVQRCTAAGTSTAVVPQPLDPADATTEMDAGENHTIEPTYTAAAILLQIPLNQRATFRWVAAPGGELVAPATASNGLGIISPTGSAVVVSAQLHVEEQ
jgi:hypothetical protein